MIKGYVNGIKSFIGGLSILERIPLNGGEDTDPTDDPANSCDNTDTHHEETNTDSSEENKAGQPATTVLDLNDPAVVEALFNSIKDMMVRNGMVVYLPMGSAYDKSSGTGYDMLIRRLYKSLANVYVDGKRVPDNRKCYRILETPNGMFTITFTDEYLKSLGDGEHTITMDFAGAGELNTMITIR